MSRVMCHVSCVMCHVSCVMCHVSRVTCHMSHVTRHVSQIKFFFFFGQSVEAQRGRVCYQRGLPRLVLLLGYIYIRNFTWFLQKNGICYTFDLFAGSYTILLQCFAFYVLVIVFLFVCFSTLHLAIYGFWLGNSYFGTNLGIVRTLCFSMSGFTNAVDYDNKTKIDGQLEFAFKRDLSVVNLEKV